MIGEPIDLYKGYPEIYEDESDFPSGFEIKCPHISELYLYNKNLEKLPEEIGSLEFLEELDLYGNKLENLPNSISNIKNLYRFSLIKNHFSDFPLEVLQMGEISELKTR